MEKQNIPQDDWGLGDGISRELCYALDENGNYTTGLSPGWEPKNIVLIEAWREIYEKLQIIANQVKENKVSSLLYFMEFNLMTPSILASSVGIPTWKVKLHFKPFFFKRISFKLKEKYAKELGISIEQLSNPDYIATLDILDEVYKKSGIKFI
ncbi:MAG: hypothetical protein A2046_09730 [Bacteroidetes bacterium GWA2_30_7]|nr:MAG: hypothetical protein A2046_09730 [Bacteroidetes bacterium GWA2_30_7]